MKYIKTFEKKKLKYNIGDYVYVVGYPSIKDNFTKISNINYYVRAYGHWDYQVYFIDGDDNIYHGAYGMHIDESDIRRKMTNEEILEFEAKIASIKYNL